MGYLYIATAIIAMTYGQLVVKWQMNMAGGATSGNFGKILFFVQDVFESMDIIRSFGDSSDIYGMDGRHDQV